jgi:SNF2 family DNA or RNA helicase
MDCQEYVPGSKSRKAKAAAGGSAKKRASTLSVAEKACAERKVMRNTANAAVKESTISAQQRRKRFVKANWEHIKKFVHSAPPSDADIAKLEHFPSFVPLTKQPACLSSNVTMRDYQLAGVNWLIKAYESGISVILGDEM